MRRQERSEVMNALILIFQISITMLTPILLATLAGVYGGAYFGKKWIPVAAFALGASAGFQNVYRLVRKYLKNDKSPGEKKREQDEESERKQR